MLGASLGKTKERDWARVEDEALWWEKAASEETSVGVERILFHL